MAAGLDRLCKRCFVQTKIGVGGTRQFTPFQHKPTGTAVFALSAGVKQINIGVVVGFDLIFGEAEDFGHGGHTVWHVMRHPYKCFNLGTVHAQIGQIAVCPAAW